MASEISNCSVAVRGVLEVRVVPHPDNRHATTAVNRMQVHAREKGLAGIFVVRTDGFHHGLDDFHHKVDGFHHVPVCRPMMIR
jgi:hypothetical protein